MMIRQCNMKFVIEMMKIIKFENLFVFIWECLNRCNGLIFYDCILKVILAHMVVMIAAKVAMVAPRTVAPQVVVKTSFASPSSTADLALAFCVFANASHAAASLKH